MVALKISLPELDDISALSFWHNGTIQPLTPDILAADFFLFVAEKYFIQNIGRIVLVAMGANLEAQEVPNKIDFLSYLHSLGRVLFDIKTVLRSTFNLNEGLKEELSNKYKLCNWIAKNLEEEDTPTSLVPILASSIKMALKQDPEPYAKAYFWQKLSNVSKFHDVELAIDSLQKSSNLFYQLKLYKKEVYWDDWARSLINLCNLYCQTNNFEKALLSIEAPIADFYDSHISDVNIRVIVQCLVNQSVALKGLGENEKAIETLRRALNLIEASPSKFCSYDLSVAYANYAASLARSSEGEYEKEAIYFAEKAVVLIESQRANHSSFFSVDYAKSLYTLSRVLFRYKLESKAIDYINQAIKVFSFFYTESPLSFGVYLAECFSLQSLIQINLNQNNIAAYSYLKAIHIYEELVELDYEQFIFDYGKGLLEFCYYIKMEILYLYIVRNICSKNRARATKEQSKISPVFLKKLLIEAQQTENKMAEIALVDILEALN